MDGLSCLSQTDAEYQLQELEAKLCNAPQVLAPGPYVVDQVKTLITCLAPSFRLDLSPLICDIDHATKQARHLTASLSLLHAADMASLSFCL